MFPPLSTALETLPELTDDDRAQLAALARPVELPAGVRVISLGSRPDGLFVLVEGEVHVRRLLPNGHVQVHVAGAEQVLGEMSLVTGDLASADVVAVDRALLWQLRREALDQAITQTPGLGERLYRALARVIARRLAGPSPTDSTAFALVQRLSTAWADALRDVRKVRLSPTIEALVRRYAEVGQRDAFLWRWASLGIDATALFELPGPVAAEVRDTKLMLVILTVLLEGIADARGSEELLEQALALPYTPPEARRWPEDLQERALLGLIAQTWDTVRARAEALPGWDRYQRLFVFDTRQVFNAMRYALLLRQIPALLNPTEHELYPPHNMNMMVFATLDLMAGPPLDAAELGLLREVAWCAQSMGQLSNMIVTWEREIPDRDFSSRVFALALARGVLSPAELGALPPEDIAARVRAAGIESALIHQWHSLRDQVAERTQGLRGVDGARLMRGLDALLGMTLASRYHL